MKVYGKILNCWMRVQWDQEQSDMINFDVKSWIKMHTWLYLIGQASWWLDHDSYADTTQKSLTLFQRN